METETEKTNNRNRKTKIKTETYYCFTIFLWYYKHFTKETEKRTNKLPETKTENRKAWEIETENKKKQNKKTKLIWFGTIFGFRLNLSTPNSNDPNSLKKECKDPTQ